MTRNFLVAVVVLAAACEPAATADDAGPPFINDCVVIVVNFDGDGDDAVLQSLEEDFPRCIADANSYTCEARATSVEQCEEELVPPLQAEVDALSPDLDATVFCGNACNE